MNIRQRTEEIEKLILSPYAVACIDSVGRDKPEDKCIIRTDFQRDRDRIIHSKAFRRLKHKTQVFISPEKDHYRTRLTHTLEVSQIARTIARALRLNEDLTEAIALGHDLGHTPFGHAGEAVLDSIHPSGFKHNEQSLRVVEILEDKRGLNLTWEVRDGILNHTGDNLPSTLEGMVVKFSDRIAYINHDIDDALRADILSTADIPEQCLEVLGSDHKSRINTMITDIITESLDKPYVRMSEGVDEATKQLRNFMYDHVYIGSKAKVEEVKVKYIIRQLYEFFIANPEEIPQDLRMKLPCESIHRLTCDYIAGMTDRYALNKYKAIFLPTAWQI
ncbi:deoxyguanosinetriphosphate triphosphohydrolase [Lutispora saccharofermentans]|uniref:Deoxyguanosinetriphosphate triphosphohydrolase-like protein n=1 Tax=Lutispora saccharofermentans TaxID=3024236 RepID=A0ABT1NJS1_9FIRM|nr:deoxyguanosinetriphosphate triphosphohydrolase [Lutispora saccharofermentans]MCQ1530824.1 deoxyguanosinetriphosphate triphosphohydrolase [Lutispora saccharofermentans]